MYVQIVEVGPRDGLQNEPARVPLEEKLRFISGLKEAGLLRIEATSFVSPKWVPQLADADELWPKLPPGPIYSALVPNEKGLERALKVGVERIALFTAASDAFVERNINMTVAGSLEVFRQVIQSFRKVHALGWVRGYVSTAFECPYAGRVPTKRVTEVASSLFEMGVNEVSLGDTIGVAGPSEVRRLIEALAGEIDLAAIALHFHDTRGTALANVSAALDRGVRVFDSSAGGLGGCPYAPGAGGNLATDDLVYFLEREGVATGIDLDRLARASLGILEALGRSPSAKAQLAVLSRSNGATSAIPQ